MRNFLLGVLFGFVVAILAAFVFVFVAVRLSARPAPVADGSILVLKVSGDLPESPPVEIPLPFFQRTAQPAVRDYWELMRKAASDSRIRAIVLMPEGISAGWGKIEELRQDVLALRRSGKPVYACLRAPGTREYYIGTAAERLYMEPEDFLNLKGLRVEMLFLKGTLDKLGVQVEVEHAGKYKSAPEMLTRTSPSPESREVANSILDDVYGRLVQTVAEARKKTPADVRAIIDQGPFVARQALGNGLVDALEYPDQVFGDLQRRLKLKEIRRIAVQDYMRVPPESVGVETGRRIALVVASGDIVRGAGSDLPNQDLMTPAEMTRQFRRAGDDSLIKGVILRIDSPGGDGFASDEIWRELQLLRRKKPVVISMSDVAASGGYYIAMTGDPIIAYPGTLTGSIGVFFGKVNAKGLYDKLGITKEILARGRFANIDSDYTPLSGEARQKLRASIDDFYVSFVNRVAQARRRPFAQVEPLAQGRVWLGAQAKGNGLVDELGGLDRAIDVLKQKAGIPRDENVRLVSYPPRRSIFDELFGRSPEAQALSPLLKFLRSSYVLSWLRGGILHQMPYRIVIE